MIENNFSVEPYCHPCHVTDFVYKIHQSESIKMVRRPSSPVYIGSRHIGFAIINALIISAFKAMYVMLMLYSGTLYTPHFSPSHRHLEKIGYSVQKSQHTRQGEKGWEYRKAFQIKIIDCRKRYSCVYGNVCVCICVCPCILY